MFNDKVQHPTPAEQIAERVLATDELLTKATSVEGGRYWMVAGDHGTVRYAALGNHVTLWNPDGGFIDPSMGRWPSRCAHAAAVSDEAVYEVLAELYRLELAHGDTHRLDATHDYASGGAL